MLYYKQGRRYVPATASMVSEVNSDYIRRVGANIGQKFNSPRDAAHYFVDLIGAREYEVFCVAYLDNRHNLLAVDEMFRGTIDGATVHPREVLRQCMQHNASAVMLAHNHPTGVPEPSQADELITVRLREVLSIVDIRVLDHIIVGGTRTTSLAERGLV